MRSLTELPSTGFHDSPPLKFPGRHYLEGRLRRPSSTDLAGTFCQMKPEFVAENGRQKSKGHPELCQTLRHPALWPAASVFCSPGEFSLQLSGLIKQNIPTGLENDSNQFCSPSPPPCGTEASPRGLVESLPIPKQS